MTTEKMFLLAGLHNHRREGPCAGEVWRGACALLEDLGLGGRENERTAGMSGGMRRRVALARRGWPLNRGVP